MDRDTLDAGLLQAHADHDLPGLIDLYTQAADQAEAAGDINAACFFLTQAFVFALEDGAPEAIPLNQRLVTHGRAHPITGPCHD